MTSTPTESPNAFFPRTVAKTVFCRDDQGSVYIQHPKFREQESWPTQTDIACWHHCESFSGQPWPCPTAYRDGVYTGFGVFCRAECVKGYMVEHAFKTESLLLLTQMARKVFGLTGKINCAAPRTSLTKFGGPFSPEDFLFNSSNVSIKLITAPFITKQMVYGTGYLPAVFTQIRETNDYCPILLSHESPRPPLVSAAPNRPESVLPPGSEGASLPVPLPNSLPSQPPPPPPPPPVLLSELLSDALPPPPPPPPRTILKVRKTKTVKPTDPRPLQGTLHALLRKH